MGADKSKKQKLSEKAEDEINVIDGELIEKLQEIQDELEKINEEASEKVLEVKQKYNVVRRPIYDKRNDIIKSIPEFWIIAFTSHPLLCEYLCEEDHPIFKHLASIEVEDSQDVKSGYSISFNFNPNPYFEDTKLTQTFAFLDEGIKKISGTTIRGKEGMGIPNGVSSRKTRDERSSEEESFFSWFSEESDEDVDEFQEEVAQIIKDEFWPNPLNFNADDGGCKKPKPLDISTSVDASDSCREGDAPSRSSSQSKFAAWFVNKLDEHRTESFTPDVYEKQMEDPLARSQYICIVLKSLLMAGKRDDSEAVEISYSDIQCLAPEEYLSSTIMNFYIRYLQGDTSPSGTGGCNYHIFNTYFYQKLKEAVLSKSMEEDQFAKFRRWWKGVNIFEKAYVLLPIHEEYHWSLVIICIPDKESPSGAIMLHLDSLGFHDSEEIFSNIRRFLTQEWKFVKQEALVDLDEEIVAVVSFSFNPGLVYLIDSVSL